MSTSENAALVRLTAHAQDESTRIEILDGNLEPVASSARMGDTTVEVPPGAYAVRFQIGSDYVQRIAILAPGSPETHVWLSDAEAPRFATSAPLRHTRSTRETHRMPAQQISLSPAIPKCEGKPGDSHLLLFARDLLEGRQNDPAQGLSLLDMAGTSIADFAVEGRRAAAQRWAGAHLALPSGAYRLRSTHENRRFTEQTIYLIKGWQTQVFLLAAGAGGRDRRAQLDSASVLMARPTQGFDPERQDMRWTESALRALRQATNVPGHMRSEMMWEKFQNPMLGIYAGLLHLRRKEIDAPMLRQVFHNLMALVGPMPDVLAIGWGLALRDADTHKDLLFMRALERPGDLATPPMLRASWDILIDASVHAPEIVPAGSFSERASQRLIAAGPWFGWRGEPPPPALDSAPVEEPFALPGLLGKIVPPGLVQALTTGGLSVALPMVANVLSRYPMAGRLLHSARFTDIERRIAQYAYPLVDTQLQALIAGNDSLRADLLEGINARDITGSGLVASLKIPASTALGGAWSLVRKLVLQPVVPHQQLLDAFVVRESHGDKALRSALEAIARLPSALRHRRGGDPVSALAIIYLRYRGSPAADQDARADPAQTVRLLTENDYVAGDDGHMPDAAFLDQVVAEVRERLLADIAGRIERQEARLPFGWQERVLPAPGTHGMHSLLPAPASEVAPNLPPGVVGPAVPPFEEVRPSPVLTAAKTGARASAAGTKQDQKKATGASFELSKSKNDKFMFNLKAGNGQVILTSQMYDTKNSALQGIESVIANAASDERYERGTTAAGEPFFLLRAADNKVIGHSQSYASVANREAGIASVKTHAAGAALKDLSAE